MAGTSIRRLPRILLPAFIGIMAVLDAHAATRLVTTAGNDSGDCLGASCRTIQYAVSQAGDGDTVSVGTGQYTEQVTIADKSLTIVGTDADTVIVQARRTGPVNGVNAFTITGAGKRVNLEHLTIRHGDVGIVASTTVNVRHCTIYHNGYDGAPYPTGFSQEDSADFYGIHATDGGAVLIAGAPAGELTDNLIHSNDRGITLTDTDGYLVRNNIVRDNVQHGIALLSSSGTGSAGNTNLAVRGNTIQDNRATGMLMVGGKAVTIEANTVEGNWNAGLMIQHPAQVLIEGNTVDGNNHQVFTGFGAVGESWGAMAVDGAEVATPSSFSVRIRENIIANTGVGRTDAGTGLRLAANVPNSEVEGNHFIGNAISVHVLAQAKTADIHFNNFEQAATGVRNDDTLGSASVERNWWGCPVGPSASGCSNVVGSANTDSPLAVPYPAAVAVAPKKFRLAPNQTAPITVDGVLLNGNTVDVTPECFFETSDDTVAVVEEGQLNAISEGAAAVLVTCFDGAHVAAASATVSVASEATPTTDDTAGNAAAALGNFAFGGGGLACTLIVREGVASDHASQVIAGLLLFSLVGLTLIVRRRSVPR